MIHGACTPEDGCGIGLTKADDDSIATINVSIDNIGELKKSVDEQLKRVALLEKVKELEKEIGNNE